MATKKITQLPTASAVVPSDLVPIVDLSDTMTQKATWTQVVQGLNGLVATLSGSKFDGPVTASLGISGSHGSFGTGHIATTGFVRLANNGGMYARRSANDADMPMLLTDASDALYLGTTSAYNGGWQFGTLRIYSTAAGTVYIGNGASTQFYVGDNTVTTAAPLMANAGMSGSLTRLTNGTSYLVAGANTTIVTQSNGSVLITATGGTAAAGGSTGDIQYNNLGALDGVSGFSYNGQRITLATPLTASVGLSASFLQVGTANVATDGTIRAPAGFTIKYNVNGVTRPLIEGSTGAEIIIGGGGATDTVAIIKRASNGGTIYNQVGGTNFLTIAQSSIQFPSTTSAVQFSGPVTASLGLSASFVTASAGISASYLQINSSNATSNTGYIAIGGTNVPPSGMLRLGSDTGGSRDLITVRQNAADWSFLNIHNSGSSLVNVGPLANSGYQVTWRGFNHTFYGYDGAFDFYRQSDATYPLRINATDGATFNVPVTASYGVNIPTGSLIFSGSNSQDGLIRLNYTSQEIPVLTAKRDTSTTSYKVITQNDSTFTFGHRDAFNASVYGYTLTLLASSYTYLYSYNALRIELTNLDAKVYCPITCSNGISASYYNLPGASARLPNTGAIRIPYNEGNTDLVMTALYSDGTSTKNFLQYGAGNTWTIGNVDQNTYIDSYSLRTIAQNGTSYHYHNTGFGVYNYGRGAWDFNLDTTGFNLNTKPGNKAANKNQIGHRLTLSSSNPAPANQAISASTLYLTPYVGNQIALWDNTTWWEYEVDEVSLALSGMTANTNYDVFLYMNGSTPTLTTVAWSTATARATPLSRRDGVLVLSSSHTRRYIGTIRSVSTTQTEDSYGRRFVWNYYNRVKRQLIRQATFDGPVAYSGGLRPYNNDTWHAIQYVCGEDVEVEARGYGMCKYTASDWGGAVNIGVDSTSVGHATMLNGGYTIINAFTWPTAEYRGAPGVGFHTLTLLQQAGNSVNFYGDGGSPTYFQAGLVGSVWG